MQETHTLEKKDWAAKLLAIAVVVFMVSSTMVLFTPEASARTGTDSYGYTFKDSAETDGPTYDWIDLVASSTSTLVLGSSNDGAQGPMDLPFTFEFYETAYTTWGNGGDNGFITFGMALGNAWTPYRIPATQLGNAAIAGGWFDGGFCRADNPTAGVYTDTIGTAPDRKFVIQYQDQGAWWPSVYACGTPGTSGAEDALTWQIILHEGSNQITLQYQDVNGGYYSDNEYLTVGIQGSPGGTLTGIEYSYHDSPDVPINTAVTFSPPPPARNDLRLTGSVIPDPVSLADENLFGAEVTNKGVNCDTAGSCTPIDETDISVTASVFSVQETVTEYNFDDDDGGFVTMDASAPGNSDNDRPLQGMNGWTTAANDGIGNHNYGDDGAPDDGAWSSGRKSTLAGGMFSDNDKIHYDGTDILVADRGTSSIVALTTSDTVSTVLGPDTTYLANVLDVTSDDDYIYTLGRSSNLYAYNTVVCKWDRDATSSPEACNSSSVRYGVALTFYDDELFALQGGQASNAYRKAIILDATSSSLAATGKTIDYYNAISAYSYASNIDVDDATGDMYIMYRDASGTVRNYVRDSSGDYGASASDYVQYYSYSRYGHSLDVHDGYVYTNGYYYSSYYGGMKKCATSSVSITCTTLWSQFNYVQGYYRGQVAVIDNGDIYVASNYGYSYYNFWNNDDKIFVHEAGDTSGTANRILGPNPASLAALSTPVIDTSDAMGMTMTFKTSWNMYYRYEGAYMESSTDGGLTWDHVGKGLFNSGGYYGTVFNYYANPVALNIDTWTYYNTQNAYVSYSHNAPWKSHSLNLDTFTGYDDVRFRWVAGYNQYLQVYYDSFFRLDDVVITMKESGTTYVTETKTIASLAYKETASVTFFDGTTTFRPADTVHGLNVGDKLGVMISIADNGGDEDMSNNRETAFREVKFVIFADNFDSYTAGDDDMGEWQTGKVKYGRSDWGVRDKDSTSGSNSMDSGYRTQSQLPGDPYISTGDLDLKLPVEADIQMMISTYSYYLYDGYQMQISENSGDTWTLLRPETTCGEAGYGSFVGTGIIYDYAYYGNPLRGQPGYTFYGTKNTVANWAPDPQEWCKVTFDLDPYVGQSDVRFRVVAGWSTIPTFYTLYESFFRFDDLAVTGKVYSNNVGVTGLELPDPIGIDETIAVGTTVINAGINDQVANAAKLKLMIGPLGVQTLDTSDDLESYADEAAAIANGWYASSDCDTDYYTGGDVCNSWGLMGGAPGFVFNTDEGDGDETNSWGSDGGEFQMFYGGGSTEVRTGGIDFTGAPSDLILSLKHRYNYDIYSGYPSYNGGNVKISTDGGVTWSLFTPSGGYPGSISSPTSWGNPIGGQAGFVHCGSCPNSKDAPDDADEYITSEFDLSEYVGSTDVRFQFIAGFYMYKWPGEGEHWHIDSLTFSGTGMESIAYEEMVPITGAGTGGVFASGEAVEKVWNYHFEVPGNYKIIFDTWIGSDQALGDDYAGDNQVSAARETMFTVAATTADETALGKKNDDDGLRMYDSDWTSNKVPGSPKNSNQWIPSSSSASETSHSPVWWAGDDAYGTPYNGDDTSLTSPVFDLSKATSAKLVFKHRFKFYGSESAFYSYYYEGGRVEISTDGGENWAGLNPTSGEGYRGMIYDYAYYGNPLSGKTGFAMSSSGGASFVETQCRLDAYTGAGFDNMRIRFHFGGAFYNWDSNWEIDDVGIYALGFDLKQTSSSTPYTLEVGEGATITTSFLNQGQGSLGTGGAVASADAYAYVNDMSGNELWSDSEDIGALAMAYYDESGNTHGGESTDMISFTFPGMTTAGLYTIGVKVADSTGATLADLFSANNDAHHMLIVGKSAEMADPRLTGGENWAAVDNEPSEADGAIGVTWDETGVATDTLSVSIAGQGGGYSPSAPSVQIDTTVTWTNNDVTAHTVTDKDAMFDSFEIPAGSSWQMTFTEVGVFNYYCKIHPGMEGSITVVSSASADEQARTDYMKVWTAKSYLVFWANFDMSGDSAVSVYAQKKGSSLEDIDTIGLWGANGFTIVDGSDHSDVGDSLTGSSGWNPYYIYLDSTKLGYNSLDYDPSDDNAYAFVFRARGVEGSADIGGVQLIRTLDTGFFFAKDDESTIVYDIFPTLAVEMDYFAKNVGTEDNVFRLSPGLQAQGEAYDGAAFEISINVKMNGAAFDGITTSENADGSWTYAFDMEPDDEAMITVRFGAPDYDQALGEPAGNRKFDVRLSAYDVGSDENMREPITATLFIKPSQFVLDGITFNRVGVVEGDTVDITAKVWNEGNYASDVLVVFYVMDSTGKAYDTLGGTGGVQRMTRVASTTVPLMAPKPVLQDQGIYQTWYFATATWDEAFIPGETVQDFETVNIYAEINPLLEQSDLDSGFEAKDEYLNQKGDNSDTGEIAVVKDKASTPSFAVGILGMSIAALVAAVGASLRREEE